jgi:hypothetical protein
MTPRHTHPTPLSTLAAEWATVAALAFGLFALALLAACQPTPTWSWKDFGVGMLVASITVTATTRRGYALPFLAVGLLLVLSDLCTP